MNQIHRNVRDGGTDGYDSGCGPVAGSVLRGTGHMMLDLLDFIEDCLGNTERGFRFGFSWGIVLGGAMWFGIIVGLLLRKTGW